MVEPVDVVDSPATQLPGCVHGVHIEFDAVIVVVKVPVVHVVHSRFLLAEPANEVDCPAMHVAHGVHNMLLPRL